MGKDRVLKCRVDGALFFFRCSPAVSPAFGELIRKEIMNG
jgi:hypothetical protein